jgi:hypothetical protein
MRIKIYAVQNLLPRITQIFTKENNSREFGKFAASFHAVKMSLSSDERKGRFVLYVFSLLGKKTAPHFVEGSPAIQL